MADLKEELHGKLQAGRAALLSKLENLSEYDRRRPMTPTGTNLLGLVKHVAGLEYGLLGESFGHPAPESLPWIEDGSIWQGADMWAKPDESSEYITDLYRRACAHADGVIAALDLEAPGSVAHWPEDRQDTTLGSSSSGWSLKQPSTLATLTSSGNSSTGRAARIRTPLTNPHGGNTSPRFKPRPMRSAPGPIGTGVIDECPSSSAGVMTGRVACMTGVLLPEPVRLAAERAERAGFTMSCAPGTGRLLAVLAAAVPANGRVLELGTGTGAGTAWITHGLQGRNDVEVITAEIDAATAALAAQYRWPSWVRLLTGDALEVIRSAGRFDLIFADAQGGNGKDSTRPLLPCDLVRTCSSTT